MPWINRPARLSFLCFASLLLQGCIISERIPSWPEGTAGQLDLTPEQELIVVARINGQPVRLRVETGYAGIILNSASAQRVGLRPSMFRSAVQVGRTRVRGETGVAPVVIGGASDDRRILWFERDIAVGVDGIINIADLPYERVPFISDPPIPANRRSPSRRRPRPSGISLTATPSGTSN